jgi:hypothetical protein
MNNLLFILYKSNEHNEYNLFNNKNNAILFLLENIKNELEILVKLQSFTKNVLSFSKINEFKLVGYIKNSGIKYQEYYFDILNFNIVDCLLNKINIDNEYRYAYDVLINKIKLLYNNLNSKKDPKKEITSNLQNSLRNATSKEEFKQKIIELKEKQKIKQKQLDEINNNYIEEEKKYINVRDNFESQKKDSLMKKEDYDNKLREFKANKKSYFLMKNDINNNKLDENDINPIFKKTFDIFECMKNNNDIDEDDDSEDENIIHDQINIFLKKYKDMEEDEMIQKFIFDKKIYYSIKKDIENNEIYESDVPTKFNLKYLVYKTLDNKNIINETDTQELNIHEQFNQFVDLYEKLNTKKYIPPNINYMDDESRNKILDNIIDDDHYDDLNNMITN